MKRRFTILAAAFVLFAFLALPMGMKGQTREAETFTFSELGYSNGDDVTTVEGDNVTLTFAQGDGSTPPRYYNTGAGVRMYTGNTLEVALNDQEGETRITAINFTFSGTYTGSLQNWTGSETSVSFTNTASGQARIQVIAVTFSEGGTPTPTTYTVTYVCNGGTSGCPENVTGITAGTSITLAAAPTKTDYTFDGWNDGSTTYEAGANYTVNGNVTFTAQWTEIVSGDEQWVLTNLADLTEDDVFVIVGNNGSNYAMSNNNGTGSAPSAVTVTVTDNEITSTVPSTIKWTVSGDAANGYTFYPYGSTTTWLYCNTTASSSSNNNMRVGTGERHNFELNSNNFLVTKDSNTARYLSIYFNNEEAQDWRGYINTNLSPAMSFYKKVTGGVIPPSITAANVDIAYNATSGSIAYEINNGVTGGIMSVATESDWLTLGQGTTSPISFTCSANEGATDRTATVTLTYTYNRATATTNVTVTQAGNPIVIDNISDITATGDDYAVIGTVVAANARGFVIGDGTGYVYTYLNAAPEVAVGDIKKISGTMGSYNHVLQFTSTATIENATNSNYNNTPAIQVLDATGIGTYSEGLHLSDYVQIEGTLLISTNTSGTTTYYNIRVNGLETDASVSNPTSDQITALTALENKQVIVKGYFVGFSSGHFNVVMESVEEVTVPVITVPNATVNVPTEGAEGTIEVLYNNFTELAATIYFCNENGEVATYDWIVAEVNDEDDIAYTVSANNGEARTAYLKVYSSNIYSNLVTINQAAYVAPTYAELPFEFNLGKAAIEETDGLYQEGLGTDYNASTAPNTKLKFDNTGDWLLLQFNERPGTLTFNIRNNSFSGGTFKVQTSEDGVAYSDLFIYTEIAGTQDEEFPNLGENVRFIKWIYTERVNGNVGLGNIVLNEYTEPVPTISLDEYEIEMSAEGGEGTIDATYENIDVELYSYRLGVEACTEYGETTTYDWITAEMDSDYNVHYVVEANQGDARTAYFKVFYDEGMVGAEEWKDGGTFISGGDIYYSDLVTISQAAYVAPSTTGTIMFGNNEGRTPINAASVTGNDSMGNSWTITTIGTTSFTQHGDYSQVGSRSNPATSITFTTTLPEAMTITSFEARFSGYSGTAGTINLLVDEQNVGTGSLNELEEITVENTISAMGTVLTVTVTDIERGVNCYYISYTIGTNITVTQTLELTAGWNWVSTYIDMNEIDGMAMLMTALGDNATQIATFDDSAEYFEGEWYWGSDGEHQLTNSNMVMVEVPEDCTVTLEGPALTRTVEITINPGWNWIGFPFDTEMSFSAAMAGFNAENEDAFASSFDSNEYFEGRWYNNFETLVPGQGYMYESKATTTKTLVYQIGDSKARRIVATTPGQFKKLIEQQQ